MMVPVNGFDAARISIAYDLPIHTFVDAVDDESELAGVFRIGSRHCSLMLAKNASRPSACTFLEPMSDDSERCGVWTNRPRVCAIFPMALEDGVVDVRDNPVCPKSNWTRDTLTQELWRGFIAQDARDWQIYGEIVRRWNASLEADIDDDGSTFFNFLRDACR